MCSCATSMCVGLCARVCGPVRVSFRVGSLLRHFACGREWGPLPHPNPQLRQTGKFTSEPGCAGGASSYTSAAPPLTQCHLRRRSSSCRAPAPARVPPCCRSTGSQACSGLRAPARSRLVERSGAGPLRPRPRPKEGSGLLSTPFKSQPRTQPCSSSTVARGCSLASDFTAYWIWLASDPTRGWRVARDQELNYLLGCPNQASYGAFLPPTPAL